MIQLKVYTDADKLEQFFLDLYETEPIKLTLSIEDITTADATSTYSKAFKVPGTRKNAEFFKNAFDVDDVMYDVTIKKPAEILVDGTEFKEGHVRLQRIYTNTELDRYDYELLFLGETRDFSSKIGDRGLCELDLPELVGNATNNNIDVAGVVASWQAYPENASLTAGLHDGNIIYPLVDHGNSYNSAGTLEQTRIALNFAGGDHFTRSTGSNPLGLARMKPMIRAKRILDEIFTVAEYTYTSDFLDSDLFHQIYISAFGNEATVSFEAAGDSTSSINTCYGENLTASQNVSIGTINQSALLDISQNQVDPGNNLDPNDYTVPTASGSYQFRGECYYDGNIENSNGAPSQVNARLNLWNVTKNLSLFASSPNNNSTLQFNTTIAIQAGFFDQGDIIGLVVIPDGSLDFDVVTNVEFQVISAPGQYNPSSGLECSYKQIDFVKDILTAFRLVLAPDPNDPKNFIIEPWQTYINSGELYDWSDKLVENKDVVIEPVFFSQSETIKYDMQLGGDYVNIYHKQAYSENYGYLEFNSGNELLKGERKVDLKGIAPTPVTQVEGWVPGDNVVLPHVHTHSAEDTGLQHLPLKVKTRMLFYNGLQPFTHPNNQGGANNTWYLQDSPPLANTTYPQVSPYQEWPIVPETLNLNWYNDIQYWQTIAGYNDIGSTLYSDYWSRYITSLYNKFSRRVTAYFVLNNIDLNDFSFDDTIFVNGTYYRPEKILDVQVGAYTEVQVQLLTANDYRPTVVLDETLTNLTATGSNVGCAGTVGQINISTDGTPGFGWALSNGLTGLALNGAPAGQAPYTWSIFNVAPGSYTIDITDLLGRTGTVSVTVPASTGTIPTATFTVTDATVCTAPCNGSIQVFANAGLTINWLQGGVSGFNPTGLCPGGYSFFITDTATGCISQTYNVTVACVTPPVVWNYAQDFNCSFLGTTFLKVDVTNTPPNLSDVVDLNLIGGFINPIAGCWRPISLTQGTAQYTVNSVFADCNTCQGIPTGSFFLFQACNSLTQIVVKEGTLPIVIGKVYQLDGGPNVCWEAKQAGANANEWSGYIAETEFTDCTSCVGPLPIPLPMYSAQDEQNGSATSQCVTTVYPYPIYSINTDNPLNLVIGEYLYSDGLFQNPWDGGSPNSKARWYLLNDRTNSDPGLTAVRIDFNGRIIDLVIC